MLAWMSYVDDDIVEVIVEEESEVKQEVETIVVSRGTSR